MYSLHRFRVHPEEEEDIHFWKVYCIHRPDTCLSPSDKPEAVNDHDNVVNEDGNKVILVRTIVETSLML